MCVWDGACDQPFWEREALQLAQESEPDEIDLAPGTEPPRQPEGDVPHERSMRGIIDGHKAARKLWDLIQNSLRGVRRMISLRLACLQLLVLPSVASAQSVLRVDPFDRPSTERAHHQAETQCGFEHPQTEQLRELTAEQEAETAIHEAVHRQQLVANCDSVMAVWDRDLLVRVKAEAQASCEGWKAGNVPRSLWHARSVRAAAWWARFSTVGFDQAIAAFDEACAA